MRWWCTTLIEAQEGRARLNSLRKAVAQTGEKRNKIVKVCSKPGFGSLIQVYWKNGCILELLRRVKRTR